MKSRDGAMKTGRVADPDRPPKPSEMPGSLPERLLAEDRYAEAVIAYRAQVELAPDRLELRRGLARALEGAGVLEGALEVLDALPTVEASPHRARLQEKLRVYDRVASLFPGGQARSAGATSSELRVGAIELRYPGTEPPPATGALLAAAERALGLVERRLGWRPKDLPVELVPAGEAMLDGADRSWITALASDGVVRIRLSDLCDREPQHLAVMVTHEVVHIAVDHLSSARAPAWLGEGLAVHLSQALPDASEQQLDAVVAREAVIPLEILTQPFSVLAERDLVRLAYAQAASLVAFLEECCGDDGLSDLIRSLADISFDDALRPLHLNSYLLEREWLRWRRSRR